LFTSLICSQNITVAISRLIESSFPEEYAERKQIHQEELEKLARCEYILLLVACATVEEFPTILKEK